MKTNYQFHNQAETERFAEIISLWAKPGLVIALSGELGAGKSTFARAFIRALANPNQNFDIPSPSFSLIQLYDDTRIGVAHVDLYRLSPGAEITELGLSELLETRLVLIEWPDRLPAALSDNTLHLHFSGTGEYRSVAINPTGVWCGALQRNLEIDQFLKVNQWNNATRMFLEGDASSRRYETLRKQDQHSILMDMPHRADGPPVKGGKPYSAIAHLAEDISAVVIVNRQLCEFGYSAPRIAASDIESGLAIIENLGNLVFGKMMSQGIDMCEPMMTAVALLADMGKQNWPATLKPYDIDAQLIETDLLISWFWPHFHNTPADAALRHSFETMWRRFLPFTTPGKPHWVMRDFHSPNLIWLPERKGLQRVGLIDTQDAVLGHPAYDLASLLQDARFDIDFAWADQLYQHYENLCSQQNAFDAPGFSRAYAILGAQRASKILGIFARLHKRDGKPGYLKHMPRVSRYLARNLMHPKLSEMRQWYEMHVPQALNMGHS